MEPTKLPKRALKKLVKLFKKKNPLDVIISPQWGVYAYIMKEPINFSTGRYRSGPVIQNPS